MFDYGLPIRGAVHIGQFIFRDQMIAGKAVVDAHNISESIDFSGVCLSTDLEILIVKSMAQMKETNFSGEDYNSKFWNGHFPHYLCPLKNGQEKRYRIGLWTNKTHYERDSIQLVRECFWKWGKEIPMVVDAKVKNTAKTIDYFRLSGVEFIVSLD